MTSKETFLKCCSRPTLYILFTAMWWDVKADKNEPRENILSKTIENREILSIEKTVFQKRPTGEMKAISVAGWVAGGTWKTFCSQEKMS